MSTPVILDRWINDRKDLLTLRRVVDNGGYQVTLDSIDAPKWITRNRFSPEIIDAMSQLFGIMERVGGTWTKVSA